MNAETIRKAMETPDAFRAWLDSAEAKAIAPFKACSCGDCPIAEWVRSLLPSWAFPSVTYELIAVHGQGERWAFELPRWAQRYIVRLDARSASDRDVSLDEARAALDAI